jgi:hypothetical protein
MSRAILLQKWTTIRGLSQAAGATVTNIIQGEDQWLDVGPYQDASFWISCTEASGSPSLEIDTAPARDEVLFIPLIASFALAPLPTPVVKPALMLQAGTTTPLARWVRWKLTVAGNATWDATFRIWGVFAAPGA